MKKLFLLFFLSIISLRNTIGQETYTIKIFKNLNTVKFDKWCEKELLIEGIDNVSQKLQKFSWLPMEVRLRRTHSICTQKWLKEFSSDADFDSLNNHQKYNCLIGCILLCYILDKQKINSTIHEINNHVYIKVKKKDKQWLIETTEKNTISAITSGKYQVQKCHDKYITNLDQYFKNIDTGNTIGERSPIDRDISNKEAIGLYYYNISASAYNHNNFTLSKEMAKIAFQYYPCNRTKMILNLLGDKRNNNLAGK